MSERGSLPPEFYAARVAKFARIVNAIGDEVDSEVFSHPHTFAAYTQWMARMVRLMRVGSVNTRAWRKCRDLATELAA